jgi:predicted NAD/FAD-binding protein
MQTVAVIGSGISGMAAAYLLSSGYDVTVFEKNNVPGGHARTREVNYAGKTIPVDTGFIVYNEVNYPELVGLFRHLGVITEKSDMTFGFSMDNGQLEWAARSLNAVFAQRSNLLRPSFYRMLMDVLRFFKNAEIALERNSEFSLRELLDSLSMGQNFREHFILPMGAAIWSTPKDTMLDFPARTFVQFFKNHGLLSMSGQHQWYTVTGGSREYVKKITAPIQNKYRLNAPVDRVYRDGDQITVQSSGRTEKFDHVVFASHADETLFMLSDATSEEKAVLGAFRYQPNRAYLHSDARVMPRRRACWSSWNYYAGGDTVSLTYWMNKLQNIDNATPLFVTLNPQTPIDPRTIFDEHVFTHPVFTVEGIEAQQRIPEIQGARNMWFCGAYQRYGFHEDGLMSAVAVAKRMGVSIPWH